jgi:hypothetical protein
MNSSPTQSTSNLSIHQMHHVPPSAALVKLPKVDISYTYRQPVATTHPALQHPTSEQVLGFVIALNKLKGKDKLMLSSGYQVAMTAAHAASNWNPGRSHKLESIKNVVKSSNEAEIVAASAYEVARHWSCYDGERFHQSHRIIERAIGRTLDSTLASKYNDSCRTMMWMAMAEVAKGTTRGSTAESSEPCNLDDVLKAFHTIEAYLKTYDSRIAWPVNLNAQAKDAIRTVIREVSAFSFDQTFGDGLSKSKCAEYTGMKNAIVQTCREIEIAYPAPSNQVQSS